MIFSPVTSINLLPEMQPQPIIGMQALGLEWFYWMGSKQKTAGSRFASIPIIDCYPTRMTSGR